MSELLKELNPPGLRKKNTGAVYSAIDELIDRLNDTGKATIMDFFPMFASMTAVKRHAEAIGIPHFSFDSDEDFRERVASAGFYLDRQGERGLITETLDALVPGRYQLLEYPFAGFRVGFSRVGAAPIGGGERLFVKIRNMTESDQSVVYEFLDAMLDPDIEIHVVSWEYHPVSSANLALIRKYGGSKWIAKQLEDIGSAKVELLPDDGMKVGASLLGSARLYGARDPLIIVRCAKGLVSAVTVRLATAIDMDIQRRVIGE
jgi:hypothetical protein